MADMTEEEAKRLLSQATSPVVDTPVNLGPEETKPWPVPDLSEPTAPQSLGDRLKTAPKRKPGRPPGAKNRATLAKEAAAVGGSEGARIMSGPSRGPSKPKEPQLDPKQKHDLKIARAEKLSDDVASTINDNLLMILMAMGCPAELLYTDGNIPKKVLENSKYTPLAQQIMIGETQSNIIGRFLAEMETTDGGGKVSAAINDGKGPLVLYGVLSLAVGAQYVSGLMTAYKNMEPLLKAYAEQQKAARNIASSHAQQDTGGS